MLIKTFLKVSTRQRMLEKLKNSSRKFLETISVHGVSRIVKTENSLVKLVWTVMILSSVSFGLYTISRSINDYNRNDVITNIERVTEIPFTFPAITLCTRDYFTKDLYLNGTLQKSERLIDFSIKYFVDFEESSFKDKTLSTSQLEFFKIPKRYGHCLRFNGKINNSLQTVSSYDDKLKLVLNNVHTEIVSKEIEIEYSIYKNFDVYIEDNYVSSYLDTAPLFMETCFTYNIFLLKAETNEKLGEPYSSCHVNESSSNEYRQMNNIELCINRKIQAKYNCSISSFFQTNRLDKCNAADEVNNYDKYISRMGDLINEFYSSCKEECPKDCKSTKFNSKIYTKIEPHSYTKIYWSVGDFTSLKITQIPKMNSFSLISSIGGSLGLFIGIRFLSLVELLELVIEIMFTLFY